MAGIVTADAVRRRAGYRHVLLAVDKVRFEADSSCGRAVAVVVGVLTLMRARDILEVVSHGGFMFSGCGLVGRWYETR